MLQQGRHGSHGSIPSLVMRTGQIIAVSPDNARADVSYRHVHGMTHIPGYGEMPPGFTFPSDAPPPTGPAPTVTPLPVAPPSPTTAAVSQTVTAVPPNPIQTAPAGPPPFNPSDRHQWHHQHRGGHPMINEIRRLHPKANMHGSGDIELGEWNGKPVAKFEIASSPPAGGAQAAAMALNRAARALQVSGLSSLPPELIAGPLSALMRGGAVELHFQNGAVVRTSL